VCSVEALGPLQWHPLHWLLNLQDAALLNLQDKDIVKEKR